MQSCSKSKGYKKSCSVFGQGCSIFTHICPASAQLFAYP
nr:MAG TPA: hypothetical protein [Caudoviricetes sp.]